MESSMKLTNLFALPCSVGLMVLAYPIFNVLYPGSDSSGPDLMLMLGFASFFVCSYLITNAILQASGFEKLALFTLPIGGAIKVIVNWFLVGTPGINIMGAPIGTIACYLFITIINIVFIVTRVPGRPRFMVTFLRPLICSLAMGAAAWAVYGLAGRFISSLFIQMCAAILAGVIVYGVLVIALRAVTREDMKLIPKGEKISAILHIR